MERSKKYECMELSKHTLEKMIKDSKYLSAINKFAPDRVDDVHEFTKKSNNMVKKTRIKEFMEYSLLNNNEFDLIDLISLKLMAGSILEHSKFNVYKKLSYKKIYRSYFNYLDEGINVSNKDLSHSITLLTNELRFLKDIMDLHFNLVINNDTVSVDELCIIEKQWKECIKHIVEGNTGRIANINLITDKIKINRAIRSNVSEDILDKLEIDNTTSYISSNRKDLINIFKTFLKSLELGDLGTSIKFNEVKVKPLTRESVHLSDNQNYLEKRVNLWDFVNEHNTSNIQMFNVYSESESHVRGYIRNIVKNFGVDILPYEIYSYIDEYEDFMLNYIVTPENFNERFDEFFNDFISHASSSLSMNELELIDIKEYDSPFLIENYFENRALENIDLLHEIESYIFNISKILFFSSDIDRFIRNNLGNEINLKSLLEEYENVLIDFCNDCYTVTSPKIIDRSSNLFPKELNTEYAVISVITHEPSVIGRSKEAFKNKKVHISNHDALKSILEAKSNIEKLMSK